MKKDGGKLESSKQQPANAVAATTIILSIINMLLFFYCTQFFKTPQSLPYNFLSFKSNRLLRVKQMQKIL